MGDEASRRRPWTRLAGLEWALLALMILAVAFAGYVCLGRRDRDLDPVATLPPAAPALVHNARDDYLAAAANVEAGAPGALAALTRGFAFPCRAPARRSFDEVFHGTLLGTGQSYEEVTRLHQLSIALGQQAQRHARAGRPADAVAIALDGMRVSWELRRGAALEDARAALSLTDPACWLLQAPVIGQLSAEQARAAARRMEQEILPGEVPFLETVTEERAAQLAAVSDFFHMPRWRERIDSLSPEQAQVLRNTHKRRSYASLTSYLDACLAYAGRPYAEQLAPPTRPPDPFCRLLVRGGERSMQGEYCRTTSDQAIGRLLAAAFALRAYKAEHKAYPASLEELPAGGYLAAVPGDPFAMGAPLQYRRTRAGGVVVYSVGPDGHDDRGAVDIPFYEEGQRAVHPATTGDLLVRLG